MEKASAADGGRYIRESRRARGLALRYRIRKHPPKAARKNQENSKA